MSIPKVLSLAVFLTAPVAAQPVAFPQPFSVERQVRQIAPESGETFQTPPATEYYFGNHLAIVRANGTKALIDFERREYTEVDLKRGTYWTLTFSRLGELRERIRAAENPEGQPEKSATLASKPDVKIDQLPAAGKPNLKTTGTRRLRASIDGGANWAEATYDDSIPFGEKAVAALETLDSAFTGGPKADPTRTAELISALRSAGQGAFVVRFEKPLSVRGGRALGKSEDIVLDWKRLEKAPVEQLRIPENHKRIPSPLETVAVFAEEEAELKSRGRRQ